ncbi:MAG: TRAP transporter large permease [Firmicutes bacterium]|nr:TRAP transporter large permease [Bacillota bacterium]
MGVWLLPILLLLIITGIPISFALGFASLLGFILLDKIEFIHLIPQTLFSGLNSFPVMAMPFFMLAGEIMTRTGITDRLVNLAITLVGWLRGGLGHVNVLASVFFAGISGSAVADVAAVGPIEIEMMSRAGYKRSYAAAMTAASAVVGPIIPPSIIMVIYGAMMNVSIAGMFAAGIIPGFLIALGMMIVNHFISKKRGYPKGEVPTVKEAGKSLVQGIVPLMMPAIILGGIMFGIFTPTEAAAVAVAYALFVGFVIYRNLTMKDIILSLKGAFRTSGSVMIILGAGSVFAWLLAVDNVPQQLAEIFITIAGGSQFITLLIINILLLIVGMFMDITAALIILAPVLAPIAINVGVHPLHIGILMCVNLNIGLITPPLGACLFVSSAVAKVKFNEIIKEVFPFILVEIAVLFLITYVPATTMFIPKLLGLIN